MHVVNRDNSKPKKYFACSRSFSRKCDMSSSLTEVISLLKGPVIKMSSIYTKRTTNKEPWPLVNNE